MKLWTVPARALPITLRPFGRETIPSYTHRLSLANDLPPTAVLRTVGDIGPSGQHLLRMDVMLNQAAADRLETLTGIPRSRLRQVLPGLTRPHPRQLPTDRPVLLAHRPAPPPRPACATCVTQRATTPALIHLTERTLVCRRHRRWIGPHQHDLTGLPTILAAFHRYRVLLEQHAEQPQWIDEIVCDATRIITKWGQDNPEHHPDLARRWRNRAQTAGVDITTIGTALTLPETVALAGLLAEHRWRRDLALLPPSQHRDFYQHAAHATGARAKTLTDTWRNEEPLRHWVANHHWRFRGYRFEYNRIRPFHYRRTEPGIGYFN